MQGEWISLTMSDGHAMPCYHVMPAGERRGGGAVGVHEQARDMRPADECGERTVIGEPCVLRRDGDPQVQGCAYDKARPGPATQLAAVPAPVEQAFLVEHHAEHVTGEQCRLIGDRCTADLEHLERREVTAGALGLRVGLVRLVVIAVAVLLTAMVSAEVGLIGFIGLAAPTIVRTLGLRTETTRLLACMAAGAGLLLLCDSGVLLIASDAMLGQLRAQLTTAATAAVRASEPLDIGWLDEPALTRRVLALARPPR